jgi:hypothetical protein
MVKGWREMERDGGSRHLFGVLMVDLFTFVVLLVVMDFELKILLV